jgi:hypothetical protein
MTSQLALTFARVLIARQPGMGYANLARVSKRMLTGCSLREEQPR